MMNLFKKFMYQQGGALDPQALLDNISKAQQMGRIHGGSYQAIQPHLAEMQRYLKTKPQSALPAAQNALKGLGMSNEDLQRLINYSDEEYGIRSMELPNAQGLKSEAWDKYSEDAIKKIFPNYAKPTKMQDGGEVPAGMEQQQGGQEQLQAMVMQAVETQDPNIAMQVVMMLAQQLGIAGGQQANMGEEAMMNENPLMQYAKGGKLNIPNVKKKKTKVLDDLDLD